MFFFPPVSPSKIRGFEVTSKILFIPFSLSVLSTYSLSGLPIDVESVNELDQNPSKVNFLPFFVIEIFSPIKAEIGLWASINREIFYF